MSNNKYKYRNGTLLISFIILILLLLAVCIILALAWHDRNNYKVSLENQYQRSYMDLIENVDDIEVDLSKLVATTNLSSQQKLLQSVYVKCAMAGTNISNLPINSGSLVNVNTLINKVGGFVYSFIESNQLVEGANLQSIEDLHNSVAIVKYDLNKGYEKNIDQTIKISDGKNNVDGSSFTAGLITDEGAYSSIPSLIYDGPFSESVINKEPKMLLEKISEAEARKKIENLTDYWQGYSIEYIGTTVGKLDTYNYRLTSKNSNMYVQVLQNGGILLSAVSYGDYKGELITEDVAIKIAKNIAYDFGYGDMVSVWSQVVGNILYVNLAYTEDGVIYYGDLVKIKIDLAGGELVGWEGSNYIYSHHDREDYVSAISILEGQNLLSKSLKVIERNYCVIPNDYVGESDAFEYICTWSNYTYYIYLDSSTGNELKIMRVVNTTNGDLLQ